MIIFVPFIEPTGLIVLVVLMRIYFRLGIDLETDISRENKRTLWIDEDIQVRKETNIGYKMDRMHMKATDRSKLAKKNMDDILSAKYGKNYMWKMLNRFVTKDMN